MANESPINREIPDTLFFRFAAYGIAYGAVTQAFGYAVGRKLRPSAQ